MGTDILIEAFHGTDKKYADIIIKSDFKCRRNRKHWLGNGIYFFIDFALAKWWTTNPTRKFGVTVANSAIIKCTIKAKSNEVLDLRKLEDYRRFVDIYRSEFLPFLFEGSIEVMDNRTLDTGILRCTYCDYLNIYHRYKLIIGTFYLPDQPYMPSDYGKFFEYFSISYIEHQICVFDQTVITHKELVTL